MAAPQQTLRIAIVGSGSAGPAAAALLAQSGHFVTLFEQSAKKLPVGAGFLLQPSGMAVLKQLGCLDALLAQTARVDQLHCSNLSGSVLLDLPYSVLQSGLFGAGTHRATLLDILLQRCEAAGVTTLWGHSIAHIERNRENRVLLTTESGKRHGPYDLLVISDGARSRLRSQTSIPCRASQYPWGALWYIGKRTNVFDTNTLWQCVDSTTSLAGFLPTGTRDDLLSLFWSIRLDRIDQWRDTSLRDWKSSLLRLAPQAESFLQQIDSHQQLQIARYMDVSMSRLNGDRIAVIGDAAHALSPQLGQGVNLALTDAAELDHCIRKRPLVEALPLFSKRRKSQLRFYQLATRWLTPFFQSDYRSLAQLRDSTFPLANRLNWVRRQMVASMAGLKTGPLSQNPIPDLK